MNHYQESIRVYLLENKVRVLLRCETMSLLTSLIFTVAIPQEETTRSPKIIKL